MIWLLCLLLELFLSVWMSYSVWIFICLGLYIFSDFVVSMFMQGRQNINSHTGTHILTSINIRDLDQPYLSWRKVEHQVQECSTQQEGVIYVYVYQEVYIYCECDTWVAILCADTEAQYHSPGRSVLGRKFQTLFSTKNYDDNIIRVLRKKFYCWNTNYSQSKYIFDTVYNIHVVYNYPNNFPNKGNAERIPTLTIKHNSRYMLQINTS